MSRVISRKKTARDDEHGTEPIPREIKLACGSRWVSRHDAVKWCVAARTEREVGSESDVSNGQKRHVNDVRDFPTAGRGRTRGRHEEDTRTQPNAAMLKTLPTDMRTKMRPTHFNLQPHPPRHYPCLPSLIGALISGDAYTHKLVSPKVGYPYSTHQSGINRVT